MKVSRKSSLNIPKQIKIDLESINSSDDKFATKKGIANAKGKKLDIELAETLINERDQAWDKVNKIPASSNDLIVVTTVKKLGAYIITVTEKSPAKYRGVFVNRLQNYSLDALEELLQANFIRMDSETNKKRREEHQKEAIVKLKMLGYIAMLAENSGCILKKQYKQISIGIGEAINLISAWKKSDDKRFNKK